MVRGFLTPSRKGAKSGGWQVAGRNENLRFVKKLAFIERIH